ncbi:hypothetical protein PVAG01_06953 [Phlyctema vagabunda]|uniref:Uncharacterized protein n=1 Tax=Phlyctema vagabunda TaxID=108571 RepID=A0ABR4PB24_9HELO
MSPISARSDSMPAQLVARTWYGKTAVEGQQLTGIILGVCIFVALLVVGCWGYNRNRKRTRAKEEKLAQQKRWYEAELRRESAMGHVDEHGNPSTTPLPRSLVLGDGGVGDPLARGLDVPPEYEEPAVPLRTLSPGGRAR